MAISFAIHRSEVIFEEMKFKSGVIITPGHDSFEDPDVSSFSVRSANSVCSKLVVTIEPHMTKGPRSTTITPHDTTTSVVALRDGHRATGVNGRAPVTTVTTSNTDRARAVMITFRDCHIGPRVRPTPSSVITARDIRDNRVVTSPNLRVTASLIGAVSALVNAVINIK